MFAALLRTDDNLSLTFLRIGLGVVMFPHGAQKVLGWFGGGGYQQTIETFGGMGFPTWSVAALMVSEFLGSMLLVVGFFTRVWALSAGVAMSICMYRFHLQNGFFMNWFGKQGGEGFEYHILAIAICLALVVGGGGRMSIDEAIEPSVL